MANRQAVAKSTQTKYCVTVMIIGAGLFLIGTSLGRGGHIMAAISVLGSVIFVAGTFTLPLVLIGLTSRPSRKTYTAQQSSISYTGASGISYDLEDFHLACSSQNLRNEPSSSSTQQGRVETPIIFLPECPKVVVPIQVQPPPSYEEAVTMTQR